MKWPTPLTEAMLLKRYKRFLADVDLNGDVFTAHVPNTGSMTSCWEPNWKCALSKSDNPDRKMPWTLELTHNGETWIGVNTANANKLVKKWLQEKTLPEFAGYSTIVPEKKSVIPASISTWKVIRNLLLVTLKSKVSRSKKTVLPSFRMLFRSEARSTS